MNTKSAKIQCQFGRDDVTAAKSKKSLTKKKQRKYLNIIIMIHGHLFWHYYYRELYTPFLTMSMKTNIKDKQRMKLIRNQTIIIVIEITIICIEKIKWIIATTNHHHSTRSQRRSTYYTL